MFPLDLPQRIGSSVVSLAVVFSLLTVAAAHVAVAQPEPQLAIDADAGNGSGPCNPVDATANVQTGDELKVAVCLVNGDGVAVAAFNYRITYDDTRLIAPEIADAGAALDDNPDANAGDTTFSRPDLGGGWDCSGGVGSYPTGDEDGVSGNGVGVAYSGGCGSVAGPNTLITGPLQVVTFTAMASGTATLSLTRVSVTDDKLDEVGSCRPAVDREVVCRDATINISGTSVTVVATPAGDVTAVTPPPQGSNLGTDVPSGSPGVGEGDGAASGPAATAQGATRISGAMAEATGTAATGATASAGSAAAHTPTGNSLSSANGGGANWVLTGLIVGAVVVATAGGAVAYWYRVRPNR